MAKKKAAKKKAKAEKKTTKTKDSGEPAESASRVIKLERVVWFLVRTFNIGPGSKSKTFSGKSEGYEYELTVKPPKK